MTRIRTSLTTTPSRIVTRGHLRHRRGEIGLIDSDHWLSPNQWRISGTSWFAPLHQAAWLGASPDVVDDLIRRGAWRSLRSASSDRAVDIARARGHQHLLESLAVREPDESETRKFAAWDRQLAALIQQRTEWIDPVRVRNVPTEIIALEPLPDFYFGYPGMYGGFDISIAGDRLLVSSWSRIVGGSGQVHEITEEGCVLVNEGFI